MSRGLRAQLLRRLARRHQAGATNAMPGKPASRTRIADLCEICRDRLRRDRRIGWYCQRCDDAAEGERAMRAAWEEWIKEQP